MQQTLFLQHRLLLGIDISHTYIKCMSLSNEKWSVTSYGSINADPAKLRSSLTGSPDYLVSLLKDLKEKNIVGKLPSDQAVISIPTNLTYSRSVSLPKAAIKKLDDAIALEASQYIPVALSELNLSYEVLSETDETIEVLMSAAPKVIIENVVIACNQVGITPLVIQPSINSVARLITLTEQGHLPTVIVDIGAADTDLAILNERIRANASVQVGSNTLTYAISEKMGVTLENAHQIKVLHGLSYGAKQKKILAAVDEPLSQIVGEIHKIIRYYNERIDQSTRIEQIIIVGSGSDIPGLGEYFTDKLVMPARVASPWLALDFGSLPQPAKQFRPRYITVIGLAATKPKEVEL
ncbi:MAG: type IV pilus assembly protein PilM [Candidatus Saccharimonadales bacterium]